MAYNTFNPDDYSNNVQSAVTAARSAGGAVVLSPGKTYSLSSKIALDWNGASIGCLVPGAKAILNVSGTDTAIEFGGSLIDQCIHDLKITSSSVRTSGIGIGCQAGSTRDQARIENVFIEKQQVGAKLDAVGLGYIRDLTCVSNYSHGAMVYNTLAAAMQWNWYGRNLMATNGGAGLLYQTNTSYGPISIGEINGISTYANGTYGAAFLGSSGAPLQAIRFRDFFIGADTQDCLYLDTYGEQHTIADGYIESSGMRGFYGTAANKFTFVTNVEIRDCQRMGFAYTGTDGTFVNCNAISNGRGAIAPYGMYFEGDRNQVIGGRFGNQTGITSQTYGIVFASGSNHQAIGTNTIGNASGGITGSFSTGNV